MIDVIRLGYADSTHGRWIAEWVKEQLLHDNTSIDIQLIPVTASLIGPECNRGFNGSAHD